MSWFRSGIIMILVVLVGACAETPEDNIREYVSKVKKEKGGRIEPLPEIQEYTSETYDVASLKSPFQKESALESQEITLNDFGDVSSEGEEESVELTFRETPRPDAGRPRELLEKFPIEVLSMVGTLKKSGRMWGLVIDNEGIVHRVEVGNYMGENSGRIFQITDEKIYLQELISDGQGGWVERSASIAIGN